MGYVCWIFCWCLGNDGVIIVIYNFVFVFWDVVFFVFVCEVMLVCCDYGIVWLIVNVIEVFIVDSVGMWGIMVY